MHRLLLALCAVAAIAVGIAHTQEARRSTRTAVVECTREDIATLRRVIEDLQDARAAMEAADRRLLDLLLRHVEGGQDPPPRDPPRDPPDDPRDPPRADDPRDPPREPPDDPPPPNSELFSEVPFYVPPPPDYEVPTLVDCDWTIEAGVATSTRGLPPITGFENLIAPAYRASVAAGHELPITVGVWDDAGAVVPGGQWHPSNDRSISIPDGQGGYMGVELEIVGLDESCEVELAWSTRWGRADYLGVFNVGLRGPNDSFIIRANDGIGRLIMDGCWWLPHVTANGSVLMHTSGMHIDKWEELVWRRHRFRGEEPGDPGTLVREHSAYLKSCVGLGTWILENDLRGGNRTGFQERPEALSNPRPQGPIVIAFNYADGYGFTHGSDPATKDGGGCITSWIGPESPVYVIGNTITNARYACLVLSGQGSERNWLNADGFPIESAYLWGNTFSSPAGDRVCASISAVGTVHLWPGNSFDGPANGDLTLDAAWNFGVNGILNGDIRIYGQDTANALQGLTITTRNPSGSGEVAFDKDLLDGMVVPLPTDQVGTR